MVAQEQEQVLANEDVGMSLTAGEEADAIEAILRDELGDRLRVTRAPSYVKLEAAGALEVSLADVAELLGRAFTLADFQMIFATYYGRPYVDDEKIGVYSSMTVGVLDDEIAASRPN